MNNREIKVKIQKGKIVKYFVFDTMFSESVEIIEMFSACLMQVLLEYNLWYNNSIMKTSKYEGSKVDKAIDRKKGIKEGSARDEKMDKKISKALPARMHGKELLKKAMAVTKKK